jgi:glutamate formiminotransferase
VAVFEAVPNFSEGRDQALIDRLAADRQVIDVHADPDHNRSVLTLVGADLTRLSNALFAMIAQATDRIDLRRHSGVHPRIGAADVVPIVPLGGADIADAVTAAKTLGGRIWRELGVPVYFYADAAGGRRLAEVRAGRVEPDLGGTHHPNAGAVCVGARLPLVAFNVAFNALTMVRAREIAAQMRELPGVQALAFQLADGRTQISMNLIRPDQTGVRDVYSRACQLAGLQGEPELVGLCPTVAAGPGCNGGLLEARIAAHAARAAAETAHSRPGEEMARLAGRLEAESRSLARVPPLQDEILTAAERSAALLRVLRAAALSSAEVDGLLTLSAAGLRTAVTAETAARFRQRVALLDSWLDSAC